MRIYHPYTKWEDYIHGMWKPNRKDELEELLPIAIQFTGDHERYGAAMQRVIVEWPIGCEHNLTDHSMNQKAWVGHAAVCLELGIPEYVTRAAWHYLTKEQQDLANAQADRAIKDWNDAQNIQRSKRA